MIARNLRAAIVLVSMSSASTLRAGDIQVITWTGGGDGTSASVDENWNPVGVPSPDHNVLLPGGLDGSQTIDIDGSLLEVRLLEATNHASPIPYTFINGTIEIYLTGGNSILTRSTGGAVTVDADIVFPEMAVGPRFNVEPTAPPIVVNGNVTTSGSSSTTVLELTSRNLALPSSVTVNGVISDTESRPLALTAGFAPDSQNHRGTVTLTGANTYRGPTIVNGAVLEFNSIGNVDVNGIASALGAPRNTADGTIRLGAIDASSGTHVAGTLRYTGTAAAQTDRAIALSADGAGGVIESSGGGPLVFTASQFQLDATGGKTLTLGGTNAEANEIQADLVEITSAAGGGQGGPILFLALLKEGDGTWILSGTNSYTGGTSLNGGTLAVSADNALGNASGGLDFDGGTLRFDAAFNLADTRAISLGAGGGTLDTNGNNTTISQEISGSGSFTKTGAGNLELTGRSTYSGNTIVDGGQLEITGGGWVTNSSFGFGYIGFSTGSTGAVTVSGTDSDGNASTWTNYRGLDVGHEGDGTLDVTGGGLVTNSSNGNIGFSTGSTGTVTVSGTDSAWINSSALIVGHSGDGTLNITGGGLVTNSLTGYIGLVSTGAVTVSGTDSDGNPSTWTNSDELIVGDSGDGTLDVTGGGLVTNSIGLIGLSTGSTGAVTVAGTDSTWINSSELIVGYHGDGTLDVTGGGLVTNSFDGFIGFLTGSTGAVTVSGTDSTWINSSALIVGHSGDGTLNITGGGLVTNSFDGFIGLVPGSTSAVTVSGTDSTWINSSALIVGHSGDGTLNITGGGLVTNTDGHIGQENTATGIVTVDGTDPNGNPSTWANSGDLHVGDVNNKQFDGGDGTLYITGGGLVTNANASIAVFNNSIGAVTVSGTDSDGNPSTWTNSGELNVGNFGDGTLDITGGGLVTNSFGYIGYFFGSTGAVTVSGTDSDGNPSTWTSSGVLYVGFSGDGTLDVTGGGLVTNSSTAYIGVLPDSTGAVTVSGTDSDGNPSTWTNSSSLRVGFEGDGTLDVTGGGLVSVGDRLTIDADPDGDSDSFLNMATGGMLALNGNAGGSLAQFLDLVQGTKAIRYWDSSLADWAPITVATDGEDYTLEYLTTGDLAGYTLLTVGQLPDLPGDYNDNGVVDAADYTTWRDNLGTSATLPNDISPDIVDQYDYTVWKANFGNTAGSGGLSSSPFPLPPSPLATAVPEPASATLIAMASLLLLNRGRLGCRDNK